MIKITWEFIHRVRRLIRNTLTGIYVLCSIVSFIPTILLMSGHHDKLKSDYGILVNFMIVIGIPGALLLWILLILVFVGLIVGAIEWLFTGKFYD